MSARRRATSPVTFLASILIVLAVAGCEKGSHRDGAPIPSPSAIPEVRQSSETSPAPGSPPTPASGGSGPVISGSVWDTAFRTLEGARVEIVDGTHA